MKSNGTGGWPGRRLARASAVARLALALVAGRAAGETTLGQGMVFFSNKVAGVVDAPFRLRCPGRTNGLGENPSMKVELVMVGPGRSITPISPAVEFRHRPQAATGYFDGGVIAIPGNQGTPITVLLRYYSHAQYDGSAYYGESHPFVVTPTLPPDVPADLAGLGKQPIYMDNLLSACPLLWIEVVGESAILRHYWQGAIPVPFVFPETHEGRPVVAIGKSAFFMSPLTTLRIPESVRTIGEWAFIHSQLTNVFLPASVTNIDRTAFSACRDLKVIDVDPNNGFYASQDGVLLNKDRDTLLNYPGGRLGPYTVPGGVTKIEEAAFSGYGGLTSVSIPDSVISVGARAFESCMSLNHVLFGGDAPADLGNHFLQTPATVYYLQGAKGWGATFGGAPTAVWDPRAEALSVGVDGFGFGIRGAARLPLVIEAAGSLAAPVWEAVGTNVLSDAGLGVFREANAAGWPSRFYRFRFP